MEREDRRLLRRLGYGSPPEPAVVVGDPRPAADVVDRLLALQVVVAVASGGVEVAAARRPCGGSSVRMNSH